MFKTPDWEDDVPKTHTSFMKKNEILNKKKEKRSPQPKIISSKVSKANGKNFSKTKIKLPPKHIQSEGQKAIPVKITLSPNANLKKNYIPISNGVDKKLSKRKLEPKQIKPLKRKTSPQSKEEQNLDTQNLDELLLSAKKKKFNEVIENDDKEDLLFTEKKPKKKKKKQNDQNENNIVTSVGTDVIRNEPVNLKKNRFKMLLASESNRRHISVDNKSKKLRERMLERLKAAQFRYLNEKLYTSTGSEAHQLFKDDPVAFETYHQGYQLQVKKWPVNPLDVIVKKIMKMPKSHLIADMGCGEAALSRRIPHKVRSFDLVATTPEVEACDMARTPLLSASMDVAVYCLALMGTDLTLYLVEANRVLKTGGHLLIAEVESRFDDVENFTKEVQRLGFKLKQLDKSNKVFYFMEFTKVQAPPSKKGKLPTLTLKPCIYKRR